MLRRFAADQRTTRFTATRSDAAHHRCGDINIELTANKIIQEKKRLRALSQDIVHAHGDEIDADGIVNPRHRGNFKLRANAIGGRDQDGMTITQAFEIE